MDERGGAPGAEGSAGPPGRGELLAVGGALALYGACALAVRGFLVDDAYISLRYVRQLVAGNGLVYNVGERVEGYSNLLWVLLVAGPAALGADPLAAAKLLGAACALLAVLCVWGCARQLRWPWVAPLLLATAPPFVAWGVSGLEAPLFALLLAAVCLSFARDGRVRVGWRAGALLALLALTRPEGALFALVAGGHRLWRWRRGGPAPSRDEAGGAAVVLGALALLLAWRLAYYGAPLPNTVYAKSMGLTNPRAWMEGAAYLAQCAAAGGGALGLAAAALLAAAQPRRPEWLDFAGLGLAAYALFTLVAGGDWMPMQRFYAHVLPLAALVTHAGLARLADLLPAGRRGALVALLAGCQVAASLAGLATDRLAGGVGAGPAVPRVETHPLVAYLRERVRPGDTIAVDLAGALSYALPLGVRVVDVNGLTDAHIAHRPAQFPGGLLGRGDGFGKWDVDYVLAQDPRFVQVALTGRGADGSLRTANTGQTLLVNDPRFRQRYAPVDSSGVSGLFARR